MYLVEGIFYSTLFYYQQYTHKKRQHRNEVLGEKKRETTDSIDERIQSFFVKCKLWGGG